MENVTNVPFDKVMIGFVLSSVVLSFFLETLFNCFMLVFILVWGCSVLLFMVFIVMSSFMQPIDASISVSLENIAVMTVNQDISTMNFVVLMMDLVFTFMWVVGGVILMEVWIMIVVVLFIVKSVVM